MKKEGKKSSEENKIQPENKNRKENKEAEIPIHTIAIEECKTKTKDQIKMKENTENLTNVNVDKLSFKTNKTSK